MGDEGERDEGLETRRRGRQQGRLVRVLHAKVGGSCSMPQTPQQYTITHDNDEKKYMMIGS